MRNVVDGVIEGMAPDDQIDQVPYPLYVYYTHIYITHYTFYVGLHLQRMYCDACRFWSGVAQLVGCQQMHSIDCEKIGGQWIALCHSIGSIWCRRERKKLILKEFFFFKKKLFILQTQTILPNDIVLDKEKDTDVEFEVRDEPRTTLLAVIDWVTLKKKIDFSFGFF